MKIRIVYFSRIVLFIFRQHLCRAPLHRSKTSKTTFSEGISFPLELVNLSIIWVVQSFWTTYITFQVSNMLDSNFSFIDTTVYELKRELQPELEAPRVVRWLSCIYSNCISFISWIGVWTRHSNSTGSRSSVRLDHSWWVVTVKLNFESSLQESKRYPRT